MKNKKFSKFRTLSHFFLTLGKIKPVSQGQISIVGRKSDVISSVPKSLITKKRELLAR